MAGTFKAGSSNTTSGTNSIALGSSNSVGSSSTGAVAIGNGNTVGSSSVGAVSMGYGNTVLGVGGNYGIVALGQGNYINPGVNTAGTVVLGAQNLIETITTQGSLITGYLAYARHYNERMHSMGQWAYHTPIQFGETALWTATTNATATEAFIDGTGGSSRFTLVAGQTYGGMIHIVARKSDGSQSASYSRRVCIQRTGSTTSLVGSVQTIGTDIEDDASWDVTISADDTHDSLMITVTGVAATNIRWVARLDFVELTY
jgi:hypothetical protein